MKKLKLITTSVVLILASTIAMGQTKNNLAEQSGKSSQSHTAKKQVSGSENNSSTPANQKGSKKTKLKKNGKPSPMNDMGSITGNPTGTAQSNGVVSKSSTKPKSANKNQ